jgi:hypothetical protein
MVGFALSVTYTDPFPSTVMSLQNACEPGSEKLCFAFPVLRSKLFNALHVSLPAADPPNALKSFEQAQSVLDASSAKTPEIEREPDAPGWTNTVLSATRGFMRTIPPSPRRPTKSAPSEVDVMLSGKAFVPGTAIDSTFWVAASTVKLSTKARMASWGEHRTRLDTVTQPMSLSVERGVGFSDLVALKQHEIVERISSRQSKSPQSVPA